MKSLVLILSLITVRGNSDLLKPCTECLKTYKSCIEKNGDLEFYDPKMIVCQDAYADCFNNNHCQEEGAK